MVIADIHLIWWYEVTHVSPSLKFAKLQIQRVVITISNYGNSNQLAENLVCPLTDEKFQTSRPFCPAWESTWGYLDFSCDVNDHDLSDLCFTCIILRSEHEVKHAWKAAQWAKLAQACAREDHRRSLLDLNTPIRVQWQTMATRSGISSLQRVSIKVHH